MLTLQESILNFQDASYSRVKRGDVSYADTLKITKDELNRYVGIYKQGGNAQHLRLVRDAIDHWLRRYHGYAIQGSIGSHYISACGRTAGATVFEHVVPASKVRDMFIAGILTAEQAMHMPTCIVSKQQDLILTSNGRVSSTSNIWQFFERYNIFDDKITTHDGTEIDQDKWTLGDHFSYFSL